MNKAKIEVLDIHILLALFKCFSEQLHTLKGRNSGSVKMKFNRLLKAVRQYEKEIDKSMDIAGDNSIEDIYDIIMDYVLEGRENAIKKINNEKIKD